MKTMIWGLSIWAAGLATAASAALEPGNRLTLAHGGTSDYAVVVAATATAAEQFAADELAHFLARVTGATFPVVQETQLAGDAPAIHVGWTDFAARHAINPADWGEEEWCIRTVGNNLILTGGRPRGTMYAVYEFLEKQAGCYWLDSHTEIVPHRPTLMVEPLDLRDQPRFWQRFIACPTTSADAHWLFLVRNKNYRYEFKYRPNDDFSPEGAFHPLYGAPGHGHTFSAFVNANDWFETHPEYFSMDRQGKRIPAHDGAGPGQLCLTNPDVRRLTIEKLREYIARDIEQAAQGYLSPHKSLGYPVPPPRVYFVGQNDKYDAHCRCDSCQAIVKHEGSESGPLLEFVNAIAEAIEPDYPDVLVGTSAYNLTQPPPRTIRPRHNVLIEWCNVYSRVDQLRPLSHPCNANHYDQIKKWGAIADHLGAYDYWSIFGPYPSFPLPWTMVQTMARNIRLFADCGAETFFAEYAYYIEPGENFIALKFWLGYRLLVDPFQPVAPMIETFIKGYYGAAAPAVQAYFAYLTARIDADAQYMTAREAPHRLGYLDLDFFITSQRLFDEAQARVQPDSLHAAHVLRERFVVDSALLYLWPWLERKLPAGANMPFDKEQLTQRFEQGWKNYERHWYNRHYAKGDPNGHNKDGRLMERLAALFRDAPLPAEFRDLPSAAVADFNWLTFANHRPSQQFVPDDDATGGMAATFIQYDAIRAAEQGGDQTQQSRSDISPTSVVFGVTGGATLTLAPEAMPQDERYHLYDVGIVNLKPGAMVWAITGRRLGVEVDRLYVPNAANPGTNLWRGFISLKFTGPAYVPGSTNQSGAFMDRVLLVRSADDAELSRHTTRLAQRMADRPVVTAPRLRASAAGDPRTINWEQAAAGGTWQTLMGETPDRKVESYFAHDDDYLYIRLVESRNMAIPLSGTPFSGDHLELLFAAQRAEPCRQIGIAPDGKVSEMASGESKWESGVSVFSENNAADWTVHLAFPMKCLLPGGVRAGQTLYVNILNGDRPPLAWSPTYENNFNRRLDHLGQLNIK